MYDKQDSPQLTRADFSDADSWAEYVRTSCLTQVDEDGHAAWFEIVGTGVQVGMHRAVHGWTKQQADRAAGAWGVTWYLRNNQFMKVYDAIRLANCKGLVLNTMVSLTWSTVGLESDLDVAKVNRGFLELMRKWLTLRGVSKAWVWVLERGETYGLHSHVAVHIPDFIEDDFKAWVMGAVRTLTGVKAVVDRRKRIYTISVDHARKNNLVVQRRFFQYLMKGMSPEVRVRNPGDCHNSRRLEDVVGLKLRPQGEVTTKRAGVAREVDVSAQRKFFGAHPDLPLCPLRAGAISPNEVLTDVYLRWFEDQRLRASLSV